MDGVHILVEAVTSTLGTEPRKSRVSPLEYRNSLLNVSSFEGYHHFQMRTCPQWGEVEWCAGSGRYACEGERNEQAIVPLRIRGLEAQGCDL